MNFFISHASEDKGFVRPLATKLSKEFQVWYDEFELTLGDSLLRKIDAGLHACDFGIVILSKAFFSKRWPQAELDGLFALETANRKVILPIWLDVTAAEVAAFSPILAGRYAAQATDGLDGIIDQIRMAVGAAERTASFSAIAAAKANLEALDRRNQEAAAADRLASSPEGVQRAYQAVVALCDAMEHAFKDIRSNLRTLQFQISRREPIVLGIEGPHRILLVVKYHNQVVNSVKMASLRIYFSKRGLNAMTGEHMGGLFKTLEYTPHFDANSHVVWRTGKDLSFSNKQLEEHLVTLFTDKVKELSGK